MIPADSDDISRDYEILDSELKRFNPQLADKPRVLAISKSDMLDDELIEEITKTLPVSVPHIFISAVTGFGLDKLKDLLWNEINDENNRIEVTPITHRPLDGHHRVREEDEFIFQNVPVDEADDDFIDDEEWDDDDSYDWDEDVESADIQ